ncbi:hypothetical protein QZJ86_15785 [Methylomonas montana]|uniref:HvfA family oxazolone/thioamide-modified RiPP metallophore n=1 Tax=Methylomonas montana TaxID=3058963 RepID=UPI0026580D0B|nr:hypothetical protein [Methylomonas montana]WKJ89467.1 hypothetical protein QZJ86_15785 [Methylomonas montana]
MKKINKTPFAIAIGASLLPTLAGNIAQADSNPFALSELSSGYMLTAEAKPDQAGADKMKDGACGEGKCGASMKKSTDTKAATEGKCAGNKPAPAADKAADGKKTEGNCGANMK